MPQKWALNLVDGSHRAPILGLRIPMVNGLGRQAAQHHTDSTAEETKPFALIHVCVRRKVTLSMAG
jgi:hypothetical protein